MPEDRVAARLAIEAFLRALGRDPEREPDLVGTGARVADAYLDELCAGYRVDVDALVAASVLEGETDLVVLRGIAVSTTCPHHLMAAHGTAAVAFAPRGKLVGIGTLASLVDAFARRLTLQETIGDAVASTLVRHLTPRWAACRIVLAHGCMVGRGERQHGATVETLAVHGPEAEAARPQLYALLRDR